MVHGFNTKALRYAILILNILDHVLDKGLTIYYHLDGYINKTIFLTCQVNFTGYTIFRRN